MIDSGGAQPDQADGAERDRFRADLADALREVEVPAEAQRVAARLLGKHLGATGVDYAAVSDDGAEGVVKDGDWDGASALRGSFRLDHYGTAVMREFRAGRTIRVNDVAADERLTPSERQATIDLGVAAYVMVPLMRTGRPVAALVVHHDRPRRWAPEEVAVIEETAERTAATVERALAIAALAEREARYRSLFTSIDEGFCLCEIVTDADGHPIDYRFLEVNPSFEEKTGLVDPVGRGAREMVPDLEDHWVETMGRVALEGETVRYENRAEGLNRWFDVYAAPVEPVGSGRFVVVVNDVTDRRQAEQTLRDTAERARRGRSRTELVDSVMSNLEAVDRLAPLAARLVETLIPQLADYAILEVPGRSKPVLAVAHHDPAKLPVLRALREENRLAGAPTSIIRAAGGEALLIEQVSPEMLREVSADEGPALALLAELGPRSHIAVPVDVSGEPGALLLGLSDPSRPAYGPDELALAQEIARRVSVLFAHARVREEEHAIGVRLQQALLPAQLLEHPAAQLAARYQTGSDLLYVGGDWYDTVALPGGRICLTVGDVVGHGLDAAASMSRLRIALAALAPDADRPGHLLSRLADFATGTNGVQFATATCAFLVPETGELHYASAGHPPPLVVSVDGQTEWLEGGRSTPIGSVSLASSRPDTSHRLKPGDVLILYSDGLVERRRESITVGLARLAAAVRALANDPIDGLCERLMAELTTTSTSDDDAVLLCLRFSPVTAQLFQRRIPADARELAQTRTAIRGWLKGRQDPPSVGHRLLLTVGEGLSNAIEHAYHGRPPGVIDLSISDGGDDALQVEVRDHGRWREAVDRPGRGYGGKVIRGLSTGMRRQTGSDGTTLTFSLPISESSEL